MCRGGTESRQEAGQIFQIYPRTEALASQTAGFGPKDNFSYDVSVEHVPPSETQLLTEITQKHEAEDSELHKLA